MEETAPEEEVAAPVAASNASRMGADDEDIVSKYNLENYDDEPGMCRSMKGSSAWFFDIRSKSRISQF